MRLLAMDAFCRDSGALLQEPCVQGPSRLRSGMAWVFVRYAPADSRLCPIEQEVRAARRRLVGYAGRELVLTRTPRPGS